MGALDFNNILSGDEVDTLFMETEETPTEETVEEPEDKTGEEKENDDTKATEVINPEDLFDDGEGTKPESVGSEEEKNKETGDTTTDDGGTSPQNFYSSIANAMAVDGILPNLKEEDIEGIVDAESFSNAIEAEINARLDEKQQRISKALENGVEPSEIRNYENTLNYISSIKDAEISDETEKGEQLRYRLIFQDFINKGYSQERADKLTKRSIDAGTDVEDAKDALLSNKEFFQNRYDNLLKEAQENADKEKAERQKQSEKLKDSIMKDKTLMGDMEISSDIRKKVFDNITKPVYRDPESGEYLTAIQRYEMEHRADFLKYTGLLFTLTNGFKDFDSFVKGKVKKETKKGLRDLEKLLNNTKRDSNGNLSMVTSVKDDPEAFIKGDFKLAL